jgi:hypothetical protein
MRPLSQVTVVAVLILGGFPIIGTAEPAGAQKPPAWWGKAVAKLESRFLPAEAKPGQTVTWQLTLHLNPGYYTYPLRQVDKAAAMMVNELLFPPSQAVIFVGDARDSGQFKSKAEPILGIQELRYLPDLVIYERTAIVSPKAEPGTVQVTTTAKLNICDANNCFPTRAVPITATLKIATGGPVPVDPKYQAEVKKALSPE